MLDPWNDTETLHPESAARMRLHALFTRQSRTLEQAAARYTLKNERSPPPGFDKWFSFAGERQCLIDDYDQIQWDFEPFYELACTDPGHFQQMVDAGRNMMLRDSRGMVTIKIEKGSVQMPPYIGTSFDSDWPRTISRFAEGLPDMEFLLNGWDEPRVVFDSHAANFRERALRLTDTDPFRIAPVPTSEFFKYQSGSSSDFTTDLWPLLSMAKISPCFSDILLPAQYYYSDSMWFGSFARPNIVLWENKKPQLYWRGMSNGGHIYGENYRDFPRFRLIDLTRNHSALIDAKMTAFAEAHCTDDCDRAAIIAEYNITGPGAPREEVYQYKYLLDVDGNTFSGRYLGLLRSDVDGNTFSGRYLSLLRSGSLVFKSTAFKEYFNNWMRPYEHYVPVRADLSDLVEKLEWVLEHEEEARMIQETGRLFADSLMTDTQNDCYLYAVLLEWARLQSYANNSTLSSSGNAKLSS
ncbi:glycosyl transferase family 90-domain-containing protein [Mycena sp. CBHHK59/15]|nr:glycosyl transferase family 90-domain-containing protein [Mycena sp. CBHHK59/15]